MSLEDYLKKLTRLNIGRVGSHERPHKPALLLAIISTVESGRLHGNRICYDPDLYSLFCKYFDVVKTADDAVNMRDPFWRLRTDGFLEHCPNSGFENVVSSQSTAPTVGQLHQICSHSTLPTEFYDLLQDPHSRRQLREAIIHRYFADKAGEVQHIVDEEQGIGAYERFLEEETGATKRPSPELPETVRDQAFRRVVRRAYDHRCAACGLRVVLNDLVLVEAAHLIPFAVSHDDDPRNGMALCKNHHWAMDYDLIAPTTDLSWRVNRHLDDRIEGQRDLLDLAGRSVILPTLDRFHPKVESLRWREERLDIT